MQPKIWLRWFVCLLCSVALMPNAEAQKLLLLERANRAKTGRWPLGTTVRYTLAGEPKYWYERTLNNLDAKAATLDLDQFTVKVADIHSIKVPRKGYQRGLGALLLGFGATLTVANTIAGARGEGGADFLELYGAAAGSLGIGWFLNTRRKLLMGEKWRLRPIEIRFE